MLWDGQIGLQDIAGGAAGGLRLGRFVAKLFVCIWRRPTRSCTRRQNSSGINSDAYGSCSDFVKSIVAGWVERQPAPGERRHYDHVVIKRRHLQSRAWRWSHCSSEMIFRQLRQRNIRLAGWAPASRKSARCCIPVLHVVQTRSGALASRDGTLCGSPGSMVGVPIARSSLARCEERMHGVESAALFYTISRQFTVAFPV
jgi:hypothetical protein